VLPQKLVEKRAQFFFVFFAMSSETKDPSIFGPKAFFAESVDDKKLLQAKEQLREKLKNAGFLTLSIQYPNPWITGQVWCL
jgi:hypothetical protein